MLLGKPIHRFATYNFGKAWYILHLTLIVCNVLIINKLRSVRYLRRLLHPTYTNLTQLPHLHGETQNLLRQSVKAITGERIF